MTTKKTINIHETPKYNMNNPSVGDCFGHLRTDSLYIITDIRNNDDVHQYILTDLSNGKTYGTMVDAIQGVFQGQRESFIPLAHVEVTAAEF